MTRAGRGMRVSDLSVRPPDTCGNSVDRCAETMFTEAMNETETVLHINDEHGDRLATVEHHPTQGLSWMCIECGESAAKYKVRWLDVLWDLGRHMDAGHNNPARGLRG